MKPEKHYPQANTWMWNYCLFLGKFTCRGKHYDLGVYENDPTMISAAIVYGNKDGTYLSGDLKAFAKEDPLYTETLLRYEAYLKICNGGPEPINQHIILVQPNPAELIQHSNEYLKKGYSFRGQPFSWDTYICQAMELRK